MITLNAKMLKKCTAGAVQLLGRLDELGLLVDGHAEFDIRKHALGKRQTVERQLEQLQEWGWIHIRPGSKGYHWSFDLTSAKAAFAEWWATHPAADAWPKFFPLIYDELRTQFTSMKQETFDARVRESLISALAGSDENPVESRQILNWVKRALERPIKIEETGSDKGSKSSCPKQTVTAAEMQAMYRGTQLENGNPLMKY